MLCIGSSYITDTLITDKKAAYAWISFEQFPIFNIYAEKDGLSINDLPIISGGIRTHCIIDGNVPRKEIGTCPVVVLRNPTSRYSLTLILSKLGLKNAVTIYYLSTRETLAQLPEYDTERNNEDKYKIIYAFESRKLPLLGLSFTPVMSLYRLLTYYGIESYIQITNLSWDPCSLYILSEMDEKKIGNVGRFALSMMSTSGPLFNFSGKRDDDYFKLVKTKLMKYSGSTMLEVYLKIAKEFIRESPLSIEKWAEENGFYSSYLFNVVNSFRSISNKSYKDRESTEPEFFKQCAQKIFKLEPNRLLQLNEPMEAYTDPNENLYIVEDLIITDKPILLIYLDKNEKYVKSYIPFA